MITKITKDYLFDTKALAANDSPEMVIIKRLSKKINEIIDEVNLQHG